MSSLRGNAQEAADNARPISAVAKLRMTSNGCCVLPAFDAAASQVARTTSRRRGPNLSKTERSSAGTKVGWNSGHARSEHGQSWPIRGGRI